MGLLSKDNIAHKTTLGVWKKEESLELLESVFFLNKNEEIEYFKISNEARKREWLTTRILLTELLEKRTHIFYNEHRRPYINNHSLNISISHSRNFVAIIISTDYLIGVDVENISSRIEKVKHKFLNTQELEWCKNIDQLTACWSAKEAVFKIYEKELDFHDMIVTPFDINTEKGRFKVIVVKKGKEGSYSINFQRIEDDILTYTLSKSLID